MRKSTTFLEQILGFSSPEFFLTYSVSVSILWGFCWTILLMISIGPKTLSSIRRCRVLPIANDFYRMLNF